MVRLSGRSLLLLVSWLTLSSAGPAVAQLLPVPEPALDAVEPAVREQLEEQRRDLDARIGKADDATLGALFGGMGELYLTYDLVEPAEACLVNAEKLAPTFRWRYLLGTLYQLDNRLDLAIEAFERALEIEPGNGATLVRLGDAWLRREDWDKARRYYERALSVPDYEAAAQYGLGQIALEQDRLEEAIRLFEEVLTRQPQASVVHYQLGQVYRRTGDREKMQLHFDQRGDEKVVFPDPIALELQSNATGVGAWLVLGRMSLGSGLIDVAEERFRKAVAIDPDSAPARRSLASALQKQGRTAEAIAEYEQAIRLEPENAGLRYFVAQLLMSLQPRTAEGGLDLDAVRDNNRRAAAHMRSALEQADDYLPGWVQLAGALERSGDLEGAERASARALEMRPGAADLVVYRASLLLGLERADEARALLESLQGAPVLEPETEFKLARILEQVGDTERAIERYRSVVEGAAGSSVPGAAPLEVGAGSAGVVPLAWFRLGNLLVGRGELAEAEKAFRAAIDQVPSMTEAHFNLATILGRQERFLEAASYHGNVIAYDPDNQEARFAQAMALILGGEYGQARDRLKTAVELFPRQPMFAHLLARLLVAAPDDQVRDAALGLELARRLMEAQPSPDHAETLAMALAESGDFAQAVELQKKVVEGLEERQAPTLAGARERLSAYERGVPVRSPWSQ